MNGKPTEDISAAISVKRNRTEPIFRFSVIRNFGFDFRRKPNFNSVRFGSVRLSDIYLILFNSEKTEKKYFKKKPVQTVISVIIG